MASPDIYSASEVMASIADIESLLDQNAVTNSTYQQMLLGFYVLAQSLLQCENTHLTLLNWLSLYKKLQVAINPGDDLMRSQFDVTVPVAVAYVIPCLQKSGLAIPYYHYKVLKMLHDLLEYVKVETVVEVTKGRQGLISHLWSIIGYIGDFNTQQLALGLIVRLLKPVDREQLDKEVAYISSSQNELTEKLYKVIEVARHPSGQFDKVARHLLNYHNLNLACAERIYTFRCISINLGNKITFFKKVTADYFWIDINNWPRTMTFQGCYQKNSNSPYKEVTVLLEVTKLKLDVVTMTVGFKQPPLFSEEIVDVGRLKRVNFAQLRLELQEAMRFEENYDLLKQYTSDNYFEIFQSPRQYEKDQLAAIPVLSKSSTAVASPQRVVRPTRERPRQLSLSARKSQGRRQLEKSLQISAQKPSAMNVGSLTQPMNESPKKSEGYQATNQYSEPINISNENVGLQQFETSMDDIPSTSEAARRQLQQSNNDANCPANNFTDISNVESSEIYQAADLLSLQLSSGTNSAPGMQPASPKIFFSTIELNAEQYNYPQNLYECINDAPAVINNTESFIIAQIPDNQQYQPRDDDYMILDEYIGKDLEPVTPIKAYEDLLPGKNLITSTPIVDTCKVSEQVITDEVAELSSPQQPKVYFINEVGNHWQREAATDLLQSYKENIHTAVTNSVYQSESVGLQVYKNCICKVSDQLISMNRAEFDSLDVIENAITNNLDEIYAVNSAQPLRADDSFKKKNDAALKSLNYQNDVAEESEKTLELVRTKAIELRNRQWSDFVDDALVKITKEVSDLKELD